MDGSDGKVNVDPTVEGAGDGLGSNFLVVGIGASAGGIQALKSFFENVPADSGIAYVVIIHLSPDHDSQLASVLQATTGIPVTQVTETVRVVPDHVYVIPPNQALEVHDGRLTLSNVTRIEERRAPVDLFFRTLAQSMGSRAVAVVLSGTGPNGSMGMKRVKEMGGICIVQDPAEAEYSDMPRNSIATGLVDDVLPAAQIPAKIIAFRDKLGTVRIPEKPEGRLHADEHALREIFTHLRVKTGHDFSNYKRATIMRRLERRINVRELEDLAGYAAYLKQLPEEANVLLKDLLISVTNFFRDPQAFLTLENDIIPKILHRKETGDSVRVWVPGCATGEEAFSIAMLLAEHTLGVLDAPAVQVFATDIDVDAIAAARDALYNESDIADVSPERLRRFFTKEAGGFRIRREIREMILFAIHNILKDPPFSHLDLVSCRNLLIYLNRTAQERVLETIHFALEPTGYLLLGSSESVDHVSNLFVPVNKEQHIFQARPLVTPRAFPVPEIAPFPRYDQLRLLQPSVTTESRVLERMSFAALHQQLLEHYAPPSIVVNEEYDIVHMSERAGRYLQFTGGEPSTNLLKAIRPELRLEVRTALYQAVQRRTNVEAKNLKVTLDNREENLNVIIRPVLGEGDPVRGFILVLFETANEDESDGDHMELLSAVEPVARQLEEELTRTKSQLRMTIDQYEVQNEELKASNEELQAMNEELRSAAEELETSKEELQSLNEELTTVNQELKIKIEELSHANNDFQNLMNSTDIGTIFLDRTFRIKLFTPPARRIFNLIPADVGRPLQDITSKLDYDGLAKDVELVQQKLQTLEREVSTSDGEWYLLRLLPYRTAEDRINGVVMTFINTTVRKQAQTAIAGDLRYTQILRELSAQSVTNGDIQTLYDKILAAAIEITRADAGTIQMLDENTEELVLLATKSFPPNVTDYFARVDAGSNTSCGIALDTGKRTFVDFDSKDAEDKDGSLRIHREMGLAMAQSTPLVSRSGKPIGMVSTHWKEHFKPSERQLHFLDLLSRQAADLIVQRQSEEALRESEEQLRLVTDAIPALISYIDTGLRYRFVNKYYEKWFGRTSEEIVGKHVREFLGDAAFERLLPHVEGALAGRRQSFEVEIPFKEGGTRHVSSEFVTDISPDGSVSGFYALVSDITDRKRAEKEIVEAREYAESIVQTLHEPLLVLTPDLTVKSANPSFYEHFGVNPKETIGRKIYDLGNGQWDIPALRKLLEDVLPESNVFNDYEVSHDFEDIGQRVMLLNARRLDHVQLILLGIRDIPGRKRVEEALRFNSLLLDTVEQSVIATDLEGKVTYWNRYAEEMFGWTAKEAVGRSILELTTPETEMMQAGEVMSKLRRGETWNGEFVVRRKDGSKFLSQIFNSPVTDSEGNLIGVVSVSTDISESKRIRKALTESEERFRMVVESVTEYAICTQDEDGIIQTWNTGAERIFGYSAKEAIGQHVDIIFTPQDRKNRESEKEMRMANERGRAADERWHMRKDGSRFFASGVLTPLHHQKLSGYVKIARDLTKQKEAEEALRRAHEELEQRITERTAELARMNDQLRREISERIQAERGRVRLLRQIVRAQEDERRRIARDIHDQLGQATTALRLNLETLKKQCEAVDGALCEEVEKTKKIAERLDAEVDFLIWEIRPAVLDDLGLKAAVATFVNEWSLHYKIAAEFHSTGLEKERLPSELETNIYRIAQEALNNVLKHSEASRVDILLERRDNQVILIVEDDGKGFDPKKQEKVTETDRGMGLVGMRERAVLIGGMLEIESAPGEGTTVFARIPIVLPEDAELKEG